MRVRSAFDLSSEKWKRTAGKEQRTAKEPAAVSRAQVLLIFYNLQSFAVPIRFFLAMSRSCSIGDVCRAFSASTIGRTASLSGPQPPLTNPPEPYQRDISIHNATFIHDKSGFINLFASEISALWSAYGLNRRCRILADLSKTSVRGYLIQKMARTSPCEKYHWDAQPELLSNALSNPLSLSIFSPSHTSSMALPPPFPGPCSPSRSLQ